MLYYTGPIRADWMVVFYTKIYPFCLPDSCREIARHGNSISADVIENVIFMIIKTLVSVFLRYLANCFCVCDCKNDTLICVRVECYPTLNQWKDWI